LIPLCFALLAAQIDTGGFTIRDFHFASGETLPQLRMHYRTLGHPRRSASGTVTNAVLILHGTGGTGAQFLAPVFAGELFGAGQPLARHRFDRKAPDLRDAHVSQDAASGGAIQNCRRYPRCRRAASFCATSRSLPCARSSTACTTP